MKKVKRRKVFCWWLQNHILSVVMNILESMCVMAVHARVSSESKIALSFCELFSWASRRKWMFFICHTSFLEGVFNDCLAYMFDFIIKKFMRKYYHEILIIIFIYPSEKFMYDTLCAFSLKSPECVIKFIAAHLCSFAAWFLFSLSVPFSCHKHIRIPFRLSRFIALKIIKI